MTDLGLRLAKWLPKMWRSVITMCLSLAPQKTSVKAMKTAIGEPPQYHISVTPVPAMCYSSTTYVILQYQLGGTGNSTENMSYITSK